MINIKVIKELLSLSNKGEKFVKMINIVNSNKSKEVNILELLEKLDNRELNLDKTIVLSGFLSKYAPIYEPDTYYTSTYKISDIMEKGIDEDGMKFTTRGFLVEPVSPPVSKVDIEDGLNMAFLYIKETDNPFIMTISEDGKRLKVEDRNKYIPIVLKRKDFLNLAEKEVKIECSINVIDYKKLSNLLRFRNEEFRNIYSLFYDMYNDNIDCITLNIENIIKSKDVNLEELNMVYAIEYRCKSNELEENKLEEYINNSIKKIILNDSEWKINKQILDGRQINSFLVKDDIYVNTYKNKIGFYCKINMKNRNNIRAKKKELRKLISKFKNITKKKLSYDITFITDYKDIEKNVF